MPRKRYPPLTIAWTHVSDELPDAADMWPKVLLVVESGYVRTGHYNASGFFDLWEHRLRPTHWARIPPMA